MLKRHSSVSSRNLLGREEEEEMEEITLPGECKFFTPENRFVTLTKEIDAVSALEVADKLYQAATLDDVPIVLLINSPGGDVNATLMLVDAIQSLPVPVIGLTMGNAGSGAFYAFQACHHRVMMKHSMLFWHHMVSTTIFDVVKTAEEAEKRSKDYKKVNDHILSFLKKRLALPPEEWDKIFGNKNDILFNSSEALKYNLTDKVITKITQLQTFFKNNERK